MLKINNYLVSLNLGRNRIDDEAAITLAKVMQKYSISLDEVLSRKKIFAEFTRRDDEVG